MVAKAPPPLPAGLRAVARATRVKSLRASMQQPEPFILPGVVTGVTALQAEREGFVACYLTGAGLANVEFALPDVGLVGLTDVAEQTRRVVSATSLPVMVDADTGYGGPLAVIRTVQELERAGAAAIQFEDQVIPKRCGHFEGKELVTADEMVAKIRAALMARTDDTVIVARTDAIAVEGLESALSRAARYYEAGADMIFVEAPRSIEELERTAAALKGACLMVNVVEGGKTPELDVAAYGALGYSVVLFANTIARVMAKAAANALAVLREAGTTASLYDDMLGWTARQELVGLDQADALEDHLRGISD